MNEVKFMSEKKWEVRWEKYVLDFAKKVGSKNQLTEDQKWIGDFLQTAIHYTNLFLPPMMTFINDFPVKIGAWDEESFEKKLSKSKRAEVEKIVQLFLMDYFVLYVDNRHNLNCLNEKYIFPFEFEQEVGKALFFSKLQWDSFSQMRERKDTYYPTILLLEHAYTGKEAKNEGLLEGIEVMKHTVYDQLDKALITFTTTKN